MAAATEVKGTAWAAEQVSTKVGQEISAYQLRIVLRRLAKNGTIEREEGRYQFSGVNDPAIKAAVQAIKGGALKKDTEEGTSKAKAKSTAKKAAPKKTTPKRTRKAKVEEPAEEVDELEDLDEV